MSQENVEVVRRTFDRFNRQEAKAVAELWTADGEWRPAILGGGLLESAAFRGADGLAEFVDLQAETWKSSVAEPVEIRDLGDSVLVKVRLSAVGRASGIPVERETWNVYELRDGRIATGWAFTGEEEALRAAGLEEQAVSRENADVVRRAFAAMSRRDLDAALRDVDPEVEVDWSRSRGVDAGVYHGLDATRAFWGNFLELFDRFEVVYVGEFVQRGNTWWRRTECGCKAATESTWRRNMRP
jgi:ketosteroid isomerase-like protein